MTVGSVGCLLHFLDFGHVQLLCKKRSLSRLRVHKDGLCSRKRLLLTQCFEVLNSCIGRAIQLGGEDWAWKAMCIMLSESKAPLSIDQQYLLDGVCVCVRSLFMTNLVAPSHFIRPSTDPARCLNLLPCSLTPAELQMFYLSETTTLVKKYVIWEQNNWNPMS
eukprot:5184084-Amphidinium_carterae.1